MADQGAQPSKAAKKNKKRHDKSGSSSNNKQLPIAPREILALLKEELEHAKANKDHARAAKLREQVWVVTDLVAGVRTNLPDDELAPILESITIMQPETQAPPQASETAHQGAGLTGTERKIRTLNKKLDQINTLKEKQAKGEKLEANQLEKIKAEAEIKKEITQLEEVLASIH